MSNGNIDFKRNNKIALRNFSEAVDFHDVCKLLLVRLIRRNHPDARYCPIYTEYDPLQENLDYPDIWVRLFDRKTKKRSSKIHFYVYELQEAYSESWLKKVEERYDQDNTTLIAIPLKKVRDEWLNMSGNPLDNLKTILGRYAI